jgi:hypothetical protein
LDNHVAHRGKNFSLAVRYVLYYNDKWYFLDITKSQPLWAVSTPQGGHWPLGNLSSPTTIRRAALTKEVIEQFVLQ